MNILEKTITIGDLVNGYSDRDEEGVIAFNGRLNVRPPFQREFVYKEEQQKAVIYSILDQRPINVFYWGKVDDTNRFELIDGQQRTMSICRFVQGCFSVKYNDREVCFTNLTLDEQADFKRYKWHGYVCEGTEIEKLTWFKTINIASVKLTDQELRNAVYTGAWLTSAKKYFSKTNCPAVNVGAGYISGEPIKQYVLEKVLSWAADKDGCTIETYMNAHRNDDNAEELWGYFRDVIAWAKSIFGDVYDKDMRDVPWGVLYNQYHDSFHIEDKQQFNIEVENLRDDDEITSKKGIYEYLLSGRAKDKERCLNIRAFPDSIKKKIARMHGLRCALCGKTFENLNELEADHILPWSEGGKTDESNCQLLCKACNRAKSNK